MISSTGLRTIPFHHPLYPSINFTFATDCLPTDDNLNSLIIHSHHTNQHRFTASEGGDVGAGPWFSGGDGVLRSLNND
ncbi:unnamed protein product [Ambrosiozyma monospora]|uniref:Unnamed protein product n=1 Tax=Ambrosiozyma monospora TaxID=43982 RepID=A0A9W6T9P0_AMBMO|nr:unnamed protein product [Ambrosiozyma monospora]